MMLYPLLFLLKLAYGAVAYLPKPAYRWMAIWFSYLAPRVAAKESRTFHRNVEAIFGLPPSSPFAQRFGRQVARHQLTSALETIRALVRPRELHVSGLDAFREEIERLDAIPGGKIMVSAHLGSWELIAHLTSRVSQREVHALAKPTRSGLVTRFLDWHRLRMGVQILWTDQKSALKQMFTVLKAGGWLSFVMDQKPEGRRGPQVRFFDRPVAFVGGPAELSLRSGRPLIIVFCVREGPMHYRLSYQTIASEEIEGETAETLTQRIASAFEDAINAYPEQWCWNYKRWPDAVLNSK